jgi:polyprenyl-phospho-N-acetylgalactosaminyl synthase
MQKNSIVFLIRAYNESTRIVGVIEDIMNEGYTEFVIVDDGSLDRTYDLCIERFGDMINIMRHPVNRGGGAALETGFEYIRRYAAEYSWEYVVTFDADGQMDIREIDRFIETFEKHPKLDVVIGSRVLEGSVIRNMPWYRRIIVLFGGRIFTWLISGKTPSDPHNGYRMMKVDLLDHIRLTMDGFEYSSELIDEIARGKYRWMDIPVTIRYDAYTLGKGQKASNAINIAFRMIFKKFF